MPSDNELLLSLEEVRRIIADLRDGYQLEANQAIRKDDLKQGWGALAKIEACENFLYNCKLRSGAFSPQTEAERQKLFKRNAKPRQPSRVMEMRRKAGQ
jgi:hypothetical protein